MKISFESIGQQYVTFLAGEGAQEGGVCKLSGNGAVGGCAAGEVFCGVVTQLRGGAAAVLTAGYCELPYEGTAPSVGYCKLVAAAGGVAVGTTAGREYLVVNVDTGAKTVGLFL